MTRFWRWPGEHYAGKQTRIDRARIIPAAKQARPDLWWVKAVRPDCRQLYILAIRSDQADCATLADTRLPVDQCEERLGKGMGRAATRSRTSLPIS
jgi:hypothetical protein